jgi:hypothetical protein
MASLGEMTGVGRRRRAARRLAYVPGDVALWPTFTGGPVKVARLRLNLP